MLHLCELHGLVCAPSVQVIVCPSCAMIPLLRFKDPNLVVATPDTMVTASFDLQSSISPQEHANVSAGHWVKDTGCYPTWPEVGRSIF